MTVYKIAWPLKITSDTVGLAKDATLQQINNKIVKADTDNVIIVGDNVGLAKEDTLQQINGKIVKADTDNVKIVSELAYDNNNDLKKVSIERDNVGLAKETTLQSINSTVQSINGKIVKADTDKVSGIWDYMVKQGKAFEAGETFSISSGGSVQILFANPANSGKTIKIRLIVATGKAEGRIERYVGTYGTDISVSANGTAITPINKKPDSTITSVAILEYGGTYVNNATKVIRGVIPGGSGFFAQGGQSAIGLAGVLPQGYAYLINIYNDSTSTTDFSILLEWWEE